MKKKLKLVERAKKGDSESFQLLIHDEKDKLYRMAFIYMRNEEEALEVFQECLYKALKSIHTLKNNQYFSTWLMRILINSALAKLKQNQKIVPLNGEILNQLQSADYHCEERLDLIQAMDNLEEKYKTVLLLRYYQDYTVKQIAHFLHLPEGTVKTNIRRGLEIVRLKLKGVYIDDRRNTSI